MQSNTIPFERMKEIIRTELNKINDFSDSDHQMTIEYLKGHTKIKFPIQPLTDIMLFDSLEVLKNHIEHIRIVSFEKGHYSFQALNSNIFNTDNITDNFRIDFFSLINSYAEISRKGELTMEEINSVIEIFRKLNSGDAFDPESRLKSLGASIISSGTAPDWDYIAGYTEVKRKIRESVILPLKNPEAYDSVMRLTRKSPESNMPRAVLFEGPPGVGKTTAARIIAHESSIPLIYVPVESIMSKWYGESSRNMAEIFDMCELMGGAVIFLDEIDSLAGSRDQNMFEATRRILSVLLRKLDGMDPAEKTVTIGATNRKNDLDPALISRFDQIIKFPYPNVEERAAIFSNYAKHLTEDECGHLGLKSANLTGRNIKDICEQAERRWVRKIIVKEMESVPPPFDYYRHSLQLWKNSQLQ
ncbi:MAG TPA: ATP-binding protein [Spirochaetota bacterium]|nr:ATP-binding protein [Spirochaetota bacterium]HPF04913.1 ATP-binding protein [Spirochaetota bacterium]HPJ40972.1 ATP-binding protein [Spirochaetota bacterium]HPR37081.1 ATP-binding protein [Spirochaetota bacterium]